MSSRSQLFKSVLIPGVSGLVGAAVFRAIESRCGKVTGLYHSTPCIGRERSRFVSVDLSQPEEIQRILAAVGPTLVINCAACADIAPCEEDPELARRINVDAPALMAAYCRKNGVRFVHFSTDQVFDGKGTWYREEEPPSPVHEYGRSKVAGEKAVLDAAAEAVVIRLGLVYGRSHTGSRSSSERLAQGLRSGRLLKLFDNEFRTPVLVDDVSRATIRLGESAFSGVIHVAGPDRLNRFEFGCAVAARFGLDTGNLEHALSNGLRASPPRPLDLSLDTELAAGLLPFRLKGVQEGIAAIRDGNS